MKMNKLEIILSGFIAALFILLVVVVDTEEDDISQLKYANVELQTQLDASINENIDVDYYINN
jgi:hypothetical protein